jgi:hypothetical protein
MSSTKEHRYVWAIEWHWRFPVQGQPSTTYDLYSLEPRSGVSEEDFEKFMTEEIFPAVGAIALRGGGSVRHYLLKQHGAVKWDLPSVFASKVRDESIQSKFESFAESAESQSFALVGSWETK